VEHLAKVMEIADAQEMHDPMFGIDADEDQIELLMERYEDWS
jgi:hypothetical protein